MLAAAAAASSPCDFAGAANIAAAPLPAGEAPHAGIVSRPSHHHRAPPPAPGTASTTSALAPTTMSENSAKASRAAPLARGVAGKAPGASPGRPVRDSCPAGRNTGTITTLPISAAGLRPAASRAAASAAVVS